jgi:mannose-6-phosphate isomerase-like protein (cupin superfamily)
MEVIRIDEVSEEDRGEYSIKRLFTENLPHDIENVGFYQTIIPQGNKVAKHHHEGLDEVLFFLTEGIVKTDQGEFNFEPGDSMVLKKGENHEIHPKDDQEARLIAVKLPNHKEDKIVEAD